jgi:hypothetical protein
MKTHDLQDQDGRRVILKHDSNGYSALLAEPGVGASDVTEHDVAMVAHWLGLHGVKTLYTHKGQLVALNEVMPAYPNQ